MAEKLNPIVLAKTFAIVTLFVDLTGYVWHGILGQPSFMNQLYPGFWSNWTLMLYGLVGSLVYAFILGWVFAWVYNWTAKKFK